MFDPLVLNYDMWAKVEIESGFPFILDSERQGEDDYSMGGGVWVFLFDMLT